MRDFLRASVIGSGPNGLSAAIVLANAGLDVTIYEAQQNPGGAVSSAELTLPGYSHDVGAAVRGFRSPFFSSLPLAEHGLRWIHSPIPLAHPLDDGSAVLLARDVESNESRAWRELFRPLVELWPELKEDLLAPLGIPRHPVAMARFGWSVVQAAATLRGVRERALFAGMAAHSVLPLEEITSSAMALTLGTAAHADGWPIPEGGAQRITTALLGCFSGKIVCGTRVEQPMVAEWLADPAHLVMADVSPGQLVNLAGRHLTGEFRRRLGRFRRGPGAFKLDFALSEPVPWRSKECKLAATVHLGGTFEEIAASEEAAWTAHASGRPFVLLTQPTLFDPSRAPAGRHIVWAYCHVPHGSREDMSGRIEAQIERFAPGFGECILARGAAGPADLERRNANLVGGDLTGGVADVRQLLFRPTGRGYRTTAPNLYLCSSSTPPGPGAHGMCGYHGAREALRR